MVTRSLGRVKEKTEAKSFIIKALAFVLQLVISSFIFVAIHEEFHYLAANWLNIGGYVTFSFPDGGTYWFNHPGTVTLNQNILVSLAGGLGTALLAGILWLTAHLQNSVHWAAIFCVVTLTQTIYGISEVLNIWVPGASGWGQTVAAIVAYGSSAVIYGYRVLDWLEKRKEVNPPSTVS